MAGGEAVTVRALFRELRAEFQAQHPEHATRVCQVADAIQKHSTITGGGADLVEAYVLNGVAYLAFNRQQLRQMKVEAVEDLDLDVRAAFAEAVHFYVHGQDWADTELSEAAMNRILEAVQQLPPEPPGPKLN